MQKIIEKCFFCENDFQMGPHLHDGRFLIYYKAYACQICLSSNWDGWNPRHEEKLFIHLKNQNIQIPERNEKGWLPTDLESSI